MALKRISLTYCLIIGALQSCGIETQKENYKISEPDKLKREIVNSIEIPFQTGDTIIYQSFIGICGNSSQEELNRYYEPHLNEQPYCELLKLKTKRTLFFTGDSLHALMERVCENKAKSVSVWDCFSKNKIDLAITGEAVTNNSVKIYEKYSHNDDRIFIEKRFTYSKGNWIFRIIQTSKN